MTLRRSDGSRGLAFALFFFSGFCGLLYQIIWLRLAFSAFGVITPVLSVVLSVFMLGLALGSWVAGRWVERWSTAARVPAVTMYGVAELAIGLGALLVPALFDAGERLLLPMGGMDSTRYLLISGVILAGAILPWCVCMGATFPLMIAFLRRTGLSDDSGFSFLYLANVVGAMTGTLVTAGVLIELIGLRNCLLVGAALNFTIGVVALAWGARHPYRAAAGPDETAVRSRVSAGPTVTAALAFSILFVTGFTSMAMEVVWTRAFTPVLSTTIYSFASILVTYLLATWLGSYAYRRDLRQKRVRDVPELMAMLAVFAFLPLLHDPRLGLPFPLGGIAAWITIFPFCWALGYLTPLLIDRYSGGHARPVGSAYAVNVIGCILGPLAAGYLILPHLGGRMALVALALPFLVYLLWFGLRGKLPRRTLATAGGLAAVMLVLATTVLVSYEDESYVRDGVVRRDHTATVICRGQGMGKRLFVNGFSITTLNPVTKVMAHLPLAMMERPPRSALVICFGMGTTFRSLASWDIRTVGVELVPSVKESFGYFFADADQVLAGRDREIVVDDGRRFLNRTAERFDLITLDPPPPVAAAGSGLLYAREFYDVIQRRLTPGGLLQQWFPGGEERTLEAVTASLLDAFPYVRVFKGLHAGYHLIASMMPIASPDVATLAARMPEAARRDLLEWKRGATLEEYLRQIVALEVPVQSLIRHHPQPLLTDDRPYNEYCLLRRGWNRLQGKDVRAI